MYLILGILKSLSAGKNADNKIYAEIPFIPKAGKGTGHADDSNMSTTGDQTHNKTEERKRPDKVKMW